MKSRAITIVKILSLSVILSCLVFGLYAQSQFENVLASKETLSKQKTSPIRTRTNIKLAVLDEFEITEQHKEIESWMLNLSLQKDEFTKQRQFEEWMFDENFWKVEKPVWEEKIIEEPREIDGWMENLQIEEKKGAKFYLNFREEQWMKKHAFLIL